MISKATLLAFLWALASTLQASEFSLGWEWCASKRNALAGPESESSNSRKYSPDRKIDIKHLKLDFTPDFKKRSISGTAEIRFSPIASPQSEVQLDAVDLRIASVESSRELESYHVTTEKLVFLFADEIEAGEDVTLTIAYSAEPQDGLFFRTPEMGYKKGDTHLWTQGEPERHRFWFPSYDYPNERFSTEVICHVPAGMTVLSNGKLMAQETDGNLTSYHWLQSKPHVNYLVSVVAGYFEKLEDAHKDLPIGFFTPPSDFPEAANSFVDTKKILEFFEQEIGVPYPWDKYYNVCVQGYPYGGMENTSVTTLTTRTLFSKETENLETTRHLDAHEVAHQWFGDLVTCKDWTHLWLNEGFATYYTELYEEHTFGREHLLYRMHRNARRVIESKDDKPIAWRNYDRPWEQFDYRAYPKGAWVLHMLRSQLGPELYRKAIKTYLERHEYDVVVTEDLNAAIEDVSGRSFDRFFDQWVYHGGVPKLDVQYSWDANKKQARIKVSQTQAVNVRVLMFQFPLPIRFHLAETVKDFVVDISTKEEEFYFALPEAPSAVRIDPDYTVLADISIKLPNPLTEAQANLEDDVMGRLFAVQALAKRKDSAARELLGAKLVSDSFFAVRAEAAKALGNLQTDEALTLLLESEAQADARVRLAVVEAVSRYYRASSQEWLSEVIAKERNPAITAAAIKGIAKFPGEDVGDILLAALNRSSFRNRIAASAISALRTQDEPSSAFALMAYLNANRSEFVDRDLGNALQTLGFLGRNLEADPRDEIRKFLAGFLSDPREQLHIPAVRALQKLGDPRSVSILESLQSDSGPRISLSKAADKAIESLSANKKQTQELKDLRKEVLDLRKDLDSIRKSLEKMEKQEEAAN
tara:strand:+ start:3951 stop:6563 length:2613 start_codon:yes stop_codon:yes gene_type:complete